MTDRHSEIRTYLAPSARELADRAGFVAAHYDLTNLDRASDISTSYGFRPLPQPVDNIGMVARFEYPGAAFSRERHKFDQPLGAVTDAANYYDVTRRSPEDPTVAEPVTKADITKLGKTHELYLPDFTQDITVIRALAFSLVKPPLRDQTMSLLRRPGAWLRQTREAVVPTVGGPEGKFQLPATRQEEAIGRIVAECSRAIVFERRSPAGN